MGNLYRLTASLHSRAKTLNNNSIVMIHTTLFRTKVGSGRFRSVNPVFWKIVRNILFSCNIVALNMTVSCNADVSAFSRNRIPTYRSWRICSNAHPFFQEQHPPSLRVIHHTFALWKTQSFLNDNHSLLQACTALHPLLNFVCPRSRYESHILYSPQYTT